MKPDRTKEDRTVTAHLLSIIGGILALAAVVGIGGVLASKYVESHNHRYTCEEILGPKPRPGYIAILPPGYSAVDVIGFDDGQHTDFRIWDEKHRLVCDAEGRPVE